MALENSQYGRWLFHLMLRIQWFKSTEKQKNINSNYSDRSKVHLYNCKLIVVPAYHQFQLDCISFICVCAFFFVNFQKREKKKSIQNYMHTNFLIKCLCGFGMLLQYRRYTILHFDRCNSINEFICFCFCFCVDGMWTRVCAVRLGWARVRM